MTICKPDACAIVSTVLFAVCGILYIVGFSVPVWYEYGVGSISGHFGLWQYCLLDTCDEWQSDLLADHYVATQAMMSIALGCIIISMVGHIIWLCNVSPSMTRHGSDTAKSCILCAGITGIIGSIVYGYYLYEDIELPNGYGYWLCAVSSGLMILHGSISFCWGCGSATPAQTTALAHSQMAQTAAVAVAQQPHVVYVGQQYSSQGVPMQVVQQQAPQPYFVMGTQASAPHYTVAIPAGTSYSTGKPMY